MKKSKFDEVKRDHSKEGSAFSRVGVSTTENYNFEINFLRSQTLSDFRDFFFPE